MLKRSLIGFVISIVLLLVINLSVFSWTGLVSSKLGLCEYKSIGVSTSNGYNKQLKRSYNLPQIASVMRMNRAYEVNNHDSGDRLVISRSFNGVKYNIVLEHKNGRSEFNLNTYNSHGYPTGSMADGERCTVPSYFIKRNVFRMIDDLPLDNLQQAELKEYVRIENTVNGKLFF